MTNRKVLGYVRSSAEQELQDGRINVIVWAEKSFNADTPVYIESNSEVTTPIADGGVLAELNRRLAIETQNHIPGRPYPPGTQALFNVRATVKAMEDALVKIVGLNGHDYMDGGIAAMRRVANTALSACRGEAATPAKGGDTLAQFIAEQRPLSPELASLPLDTMLDGQPATPAGHTTDRDGSIVPGSAYEGVEYDNEPLTTPACGGDDSASYWVAEREGIIEFGMSTDDANDGGASREEVNDWINDQHAPGTYRLRRLASTGSAPATSSWRPIESAPMDGTWILLRGRSAVEQSMIPVVAAFSPVGSGCVGWFDSGSFRHVESLAVEWQPLPAAPTPEPKDG